MLGWTDQTSGLRQMLVGNPPRAWDSGVVPTASSLRRAIDVKTDQYD